MTPISTPTRRTALLAALLAMGTAHAMAQVPAAQSEAPFLSENTTVMDKMMRDMDVKTTGDIDRDFVAMMVPHHQGAVDMAQTYLRYGHNPQLLRLAQEIVVTQLQEITVMRLAVGEPLPPSAPAPTQSSPTPAMSHDTMKMQ